MDNVITQHPLDAVQPDAISGAQLQTVRDQIKRNRGLQFYQSLAWRRVRNTVLADAHNECAMCGARGRYTRATMVHHVWLLRDHPELALARHYYSGGKAYAQLVPLCHDCHEIAHARRDFRSAPLTPERW